MPKPKHRRNPRLKTQRRKRAKALREFAKESIKLSIQRGLALINGKHSSTSVH
jgi:histidine ammonia-lyase